MCVFVCVCVVCRSKGVLFLQLNMYKTVDNNNN